MNSFDQSVNRLFDEVVGERWIRQIIEDSSIDFGGYKLIQILKDKKTKESSLFFTKPSHLKLKEHSLFGLENKDSSGDMPALMIIAEKGHVKLLKIFVNLGAELDLQNKEGRTALILARHSSMKTPCYASKTFVKGREALYALSHNFSHLRLGFEPNGILSLIGVS